MIKEELENRVREYFAEHSEYSEVFGETFVAVDTLTAMVDFAEQETKEQLTKAKEIIKDYMIIMKGGNITICSVPEENHCINVLKLNEQAEQFLKEIE